MQISEQPILQTRKVQLRGAIGSSNQGEAAQVGREGCSNSCSLLLSWVTLGELLNLLLLLFPPPPLRRGMKIKWGDAYDRVNVNAGSALSHARQWVGPVGLGNRCPR